MYATLCKKCLNNYQLIIISHAKLINNKGQFKPQKGWLIVCLTMCCVTALVHSI